MKTPKSRNTYFSIVTINESCGIILRKKSVLINNNNVTISIIITDTDSCNPGTYRWIKMFEIPIKIYMKSTMFQN